MFKVVWDKETRGVLLTNNVVNNALNVSPRPVFYEELDLLKMEELGWKYPRCEVPLLWCINKTYYYAGEKVMEVHGANIYDAPVVTIIDGNEDLQLEPVNMKLMIERNEDLMFLIESEAIEFIHNTYLQYSKARKSVEAIKANQLDFEALAQKASRLQKKKMAIVKQDCDSFDIMPLDEAKAQGKQTYQTTKIDVFLASFSGGKDSQVVLDLCTRALPPDAFEVIYSDTGYELPTSLSLYEDVKKHYRSKYPSLRFRTARNHDTVLNYWDKIGTPSDTHRWCCSVMKTAPLYRMLKTSDNKQAKVLTFEGVRAEESVRRSEYGRIGKSVKHNNVINARPIINWNTTEIYLYLLRYHLPINLAYRQGHARVGCIICPYSTAWDDMINNTIRKKELEPFLNRLESAAKKGGIKDVSDYIRDRSWKLRASGNYMDNINTSVSYSNIFPDFRASIKGSKYNIETWLPALGNYTIKHNEKESIGEIQYGKNIYKFKIEFCESSFDYKFTIFNASDASLIKHAKRIINKSAYCVQCEVCEVECPTGALHIVPILFIDKKLCIHCHKCLEFHDSGCIAANSLLLTTSTNMKAKSGIDRYSTFGLREEWVESFFNDPEGYWENNDLGPKQVPAVKNWLKDAEIISSDCKITELGSLLAQIYTDLPNLVWEIIWINTSYNSFVVEWFVARVKANVGITKALMEQMVQEEFPNLYSERTISNAFGSLMQFMKNSPIGTDFSQMIALSKKGEFARQEYRELSEEAFAYSLFKYSRHRSIHDLRLSDLAQTDEEHGVFREFCIDNKDAISKLRSLNSLQNRVLVAELNMGLDNISLRTDLDEISALRLMINL